MNLKKEAALKAIIFIKHQSSIGIGAGSTMAFMVELLASEAMRGMEVKVCTPSFTTRNLLLQNNLTVASIADVEEIDLYFDGCDQMDKNLNALKSGGGIHTQEKLMASMAKQFILVGDEAKYSDQLNSTYPIVIDFLPEALRYVPSRIKHLFPEVKMALRMSDKKDGAVITNNGNYLLDVWFNKWPHLSTINPLFKEINGVVETSLFYDLAHKAIIAGQEGVRIIEKPV